MITGNKMGSQHNVISKQGVSGYVYKTSEHCYLGENKKKGPVKVCPEIVRLRNKYSDRSD